MRPRANMPFTWAACNQQEDRKKRRKGASQLPAPQRKWLKSLCPYDEFGRTTESPLLLRRPRSLSFSLSNVQWIGAVHDGPHGWHRLNDVKEGVHSPQDLT